MTASSAESIGVSGAGAASRMFVINLAASTSPMALSHPSSPGLKRFTFFVSRQREEGRERFRLHMGYFASQEEAEALLETVRDIYPAAWAGPAPTTGAGRRGRIAPGSVGTAKLGVSTDVYGSSDGLVAPSAPATPIVPMAASPVASVVAAATPAAPAVIATEAAASGTDATLLAPALRHVAAAQPETQAGLDTMSNVRAVIAELSESAPSAGDTVLMPLPKSVRAVPQPPVAPPRVPAGVAPARAPAAAAAKNAVSAGSTVAAAPKGVAAGAAAKGSPAAPPARSVAAVPAPKPAAAAAPVVGSRSAADVPGGRAAAMPVAELTSADALSLLEAPVPPKDVPTVKAAALPPLTNPFEGLEHEPEVRLVTPEDTQTLVDIKVDKENNAPPCYAVQLFWSIAPIDVGKLPHLAIFDAYTLYNVEGNRQGRKWFGLRLGFFSDPNSATQVANYVRSDYKAVAVVPVAVKERDRARGGAPASAAIAPAAPAARKTTDTEFKREAMEGFELLADDRPAPAKRDLGDSAAAAVRAGNGAAPAARVMPKAAPARPAAGTPAPAPATKPGVAAGKPVGKRVVARRRPPPVPQGKTVSAGVGGAEVLESTLEILGASTLSLDDGRTTLADAAAPRPAAKKSGNRFARLLSRLGGG